MADSIDRSERTTTTDPHRIRVQSRDRAQPTPQRDVPDHLRQSDLPTMIILLLEVCETMCQSSRLSFLYSFSALNKKKCFSLLPSEEVAGTIAEMFRTSTLDVKKERKASKG